MTKKSRVKGARGELEVRDLWKNIGRTAARRSGHEQSQDGQGADVDVGEGYAVEVKRYKRIGFDIVKQALAQAQAVTLQPGRAADIPVAFVREDRGRWVVALDAFHFLEMVRELDRNAYGHPPACLECGSVQGPVEAQGVPFCRNCGEVWVEA